MAPLHARHPLDKDPQSTLVSRMIDRQWLEQHSKLFWINAHVPSASGSRSREYLFPTRPPVKQPMLQRPEYKSRDSSFGESGVSPSPSQFPHNMSYSIIANAPA
eukprot:scaffold1690_cov182-Amphora_coffeaeformis.AAC.11